VDLHQLRCFLAVAEELHFGRAARRLEMLPSALSRDIRLLETSLGTRLLVRTTRNVMLSQDGAAFIDDARALLAMPADGVAIAKTRHELGGEWSGWIVDEFAGANAGLVMAELEVPAEDTPWKVPVWAGENVTSDHRYTNAELFTHPYAHWSKD